MNPWATIVLGVGMGMGMGMAETSHLPSAAKANLLSLAAIQGQQTASQLFSTCASSKQAQSQSDFAKLVSGCIRYVHVEVNVQC